MTTTTSLRRTASRIGLAFLIGAPAAGGALAQRADAGRARQMGAELQGHAVVAMSSIHPGAYTEVVDAFIAEALATRR